MREIDVSVAAEPTPESAEAVPPVADSAPDAAAAEAPIDEVEEHDAQVSDPSLSEPESGGPESEGPDSEEPVSDEPVSEDVAPAEGSAPDDAAAKEEAELEARGPGPGEELDDDELSQQMFALLFASPEPVSMGRLIKLLDRPKKERVERLLAELGTRLEEAHVPLRVLPIAGGWRLLTQPEMSDVVARLSRARKNERISPAALETLAIVAYRQPVTKAEIEAIRGVQAGAILRTLVERGLARITGRADQPGSPLQYGTTREFLDRFGLGSLEDLPRDGELMRD